MSSAARGNGAGGGDRPYERKGKTPGGPHVRSKKQGAFESVALRYLEKNM